MATTTGTINGVFGVRDTSGVLAPAFGTLEAGVYVVQKDATPVAKHVTLDTHVYVVNAGAGTFTPNVAPVAANLYLVDPTGAYTAAQMEAAVLTWLQSAVLHDGAGGWNNPAGFAVSSKAPSVTTAAAITMA